MGVFSSKKVVVVASVAYNLAGDLENRPNYLKSLVTWNTLSGTKESMGDTIVNGHLSGPGIALRRFFNWSQLEGHYDRFGRPTGRILRAAPLKPIDVQDHVPRRTGEEVWVHRAVAGDADYSYWCDRWILIHRPEDIDTEWVYEFNSSTGRIDVTFPDNSTESIPLTGYRERSKYVYIYYQTVDPDTSPPTYSSVRLYIYRIGSGFPELDALVEDGAQYNEFFPFIPIRLQNQNLSDSFMPAAYEQVKKAYRKATGSKLIELTDIIDENESIDDIDNTYIVFGTPLNAIEPACCRYMYRFFDKLRQSQIGGPTAYQDWMDDLAAEETIQEDWDEWRNDYDVIVRPPEPTRPSIPDLPDNVIEISADGVENSEYQVRLKWSFISSGSGTGLGKTGAKSNDCWLEYTGEDSFARRILMPTGNWEEGNRSVLTILDPRAFQKFRIYWQRTPNTYDYLDVVGLVHENIVHGGKAVITTPKEAFDEVEESGLIIPLHYATWKEMSLKDSTQMANECMFAVFNCYEIHKQRWWQRGIFKILFVIIIAIVSVLFTGGAGFGLLGAHLAVGVSLGFSGMMAAIIGSVANALAALVLSTVLDLLSSSLGVLGDILGAVISFLVGNLTNILQNGLESLILNFGSLIRIDNLLQLTNVLGTGIHAYLRAEAEKLGRDMLEYSDWAREESRKIQEEYFEKFGYGAGTIDPTMFVDSTGPVVESSDTFLTRTLMTGSDIAEMSNELLSNFADLSLKLPDAYT